MTLGWLWFFLSLGIALMIAAVQQLAPTAYILWIVLFAAGLGVIVFAFAAWYRRRMPPIGD